MSHGCVTMNAVLFLVDGYNVTRSDPATRASDLSEQRDALVRRLAARGAGLLGAGELVVVFDGRGVPSSRERHGPVTVRFAADHDSADDLIVTLAARATGPVTLVSSDRELAERVRAHRGTRPVTVLPRERVFEAAAPATGRKGRKARGLGGSTAGMPKGANRITAELKDLWLEADDTND